MQPGIRSKLSLLAISNILGIKFYDWINYFETHLAIILISVFVFYIYTLGV